MIAIGSTLRSGDWYVGRFPDASHNRRADAFVGGWPLPRLARQLGNDLAESRMLNHPMDKSLMPCSRQIQLATYGHQISASEIDNDQFALQKFAPHMR
jgi:hypothetical protein